MFSIQKAHETMTAKERVLKTFNYEKTDRVPINYFTNFTVFQRLCDELGIKNYSMLEMYDALGVDYRSAWPQYKGPLLFK